MSSHKWKVKNNDEVCLLSGTVHFLRGRAGWWDLGGVTQKKRPYRGGHLKKIREKGGHVKYYLYWRGGRGKKISYLGGGSCNFLMPLQKIPPAPPTS